MKRIVLALALTAVAAACSPPPPSAPPSATATQFASPSKSPSASPTPFVDAFDPERAMDHTRHLSVDIGKRVVGSDGEKRAADYIVNALAGAGLTPTRQSFTRADGGASDNIIGRIAGADYSRGHIVVGGHYDTKGESPGGNDNGSGVGVILALAEAFSRSMAPVEFVGFAAEEFHPVSKKHHEGSLHYAASLTDPDLVLAMTSIDMVGNGSSVYIVRWRNGSDDVQMELAKVAHDLTIPHELLSRGDLSDHTSFEKRGIGAAWLWSGDHLSLHTARDTFDIVQPESVERTGRLVYEWLRVRLSL